MAQGPNEARFKNSLLGASWESVDDGAAEWKRCADLLDQVARSLDVAAGKDQKIGGRTGPAMGAAFRRTSENVVERAQLLLEGKAALDSAARVIEKAENARKAMDAQHPATDHPGSWKRPVGPLTEEDLKAQQRHQQKVNDFQENYAARERIARQWSDNMDNVFADSTEVMKKIHGEPDPPPPTKTATDGPGSVTPGTPQGPRTIPSDPTDTDPTDPRNPDDTGDPDDQDDSGGDDHGGDDHGGDDHGGDDHGGDDDNDVPSTGSDNGGGIGTGTLGGLAAVGAGGAVAFGGFRGGLQLPSALSSTGVRPIGSTGRVGTSGALGRGSAVAPGSPVTRTGTSGAAGRGVAGRGVAGTGSPVGRGGRGTAGAQGTGRGGRAGVGGIGTGRGSGKKDEEKQQAPRDLFDDGQDWIDDEGAAPNVLS